MFFFHLITVNRRSSDDRSCADIVNRKIGTKVQSPNVQSLPRSVLPEERIKAFIRSEVKLKVPKKSLMLF